MSGVFGAILILACMFGVIYFGCTLVVDIRDKRRKKKPKDKHDEK